MSSNVAWRAAGAFAIGLAGCAHHAAQPAPEPAPATAATLPDPPVLPAVPRPVEPAAVDPAVAAPAAAPTAAPPTAPTAPVAAAGPLTAHVVGFQVATAGGLIVTVDHGRSAGVAPGWRGHLVDPAGKPVAGGEFTIARITATEAQGSVSLSADQLSASDLAVLEPP